jgi:ATP-dependent RNA helicase RhlE
MTFAELRLSEPIVRAVADAGYTAPTPIQSQSIPPVLAGRDLLGCAQTGTGKTGAFALPILHRLAPSKRRSHANRTTRDIRPRGLILCPTRELASQIEQSLETYGRHLPLRHTAIFGGVSQVKQVRALRAGVDIVVATPGRLLDLLGQKCIDLSAIEILVLDEADRMLDMGFIRDIRRLIEFVPQQRQTLLFSATMPGEIRRLADAILNDAVSVQVDPVASTAEAISQHVYHVAKKDKAALLVRVINEHAMQRTLVFTRTKHGADKLVRVLGKSGIDASAIHGNKTQGARTRALTGFKNGRTPVLVATDIASRGIDVDEITHVINFDIPNEAETYVHRIGRTARAGSSGVALSFCDGEERKDLRAIERLIDRSLEVAGGHAPAHVARTAKSEKDADARPRSRNANRRRRSRPRARQSGRTQQAMAT